jgi:hypothetical protein
MTTTEWRELVAAATITAVPVRAPGKGVWWTWDVTVNGADASDYLDAGSVRTKREATDLVDSVIAAVRESLSDPWNLRNHLDADTDTRHGRSDPVVAATLDVSHGVGY